MRSGAILGGWMAVAAVLFAAATPAHAATLPVDPVKARLVAETASIAPGATLWVDLHLDIAPGWHTYWRNPGDSGLPTEIAWTLPAGFSAGDIQWPAPERFVLGTIGNYGYSGTADLLVPITAPANLRRDATAHLAAAATWLVCSDICIPGEAKLALDLPVSSEAATADRAAVTLFAAARHRLPQAAGFATSFIIAGKTLRLVIPNEAFAGNTNPTAAFFPFDANLIDAAAEPKQERRNDKIELLLTRLARTGAAPPRLAGVLTLRGGDGGEHAYTIAATPLSGTGIDAADAESATGWWQAVLLALLGGLALNLMPCVFPILSLKLLGLATAVHHDEERQHGLAYAAGVVLSFTLLGGVLLVLRTGGAAIGWGFQLQSPVVVALLAYLLFAMALSLSGVVEFGSGLGGIGSRFAGRAGLAGAFATGVLATIVATPCTAPFMGAALGFALVAPAPAALAIFVALGVGLAAPIVLASMVPGVARLLPRPGRWMLWLKQLLAFPLYGTVAWLLWVVIQETGPTGAFSALLGLVTVGFAAWIYGRTRAAGMTLRHSGTAVAAAGIIAAVVLAAALSPDTRPTATADAASGGLGYEQFTAERLSRLEAAHQPVFINLTAAWCITCLFNERTALDSAEVRRAFAERQIVALKGDWTRRDPAIAAFLQKFGRSGVPLYLLYGRDGTATVLPQILTEANVLEAVGKI